MRHLSFCFLLGTLAASAAERPISYAFDVRPILSDKCFACHGPDGSKRDSGLRLDNADGAYGPLKDSPGSAIVPGDPKKSVAWQRILSKDPEVVMPPPKSHLFLSDEEKNVIQRWIKEGGKYEPHWAFQPLPETVAVPVPKDTAWPQQELDRFVLARLESESLTPSPAADPLRWLRRVTLDLTGLPPTTEEITAFQQNPDKAAAVDRLLASPRFGEHFAVRWLDAARYADSYGYQADALTNFWPWRDWVIRSLNSNLPIDQFMTWQIAGDLLPNATRDQQLATTFNRLHRLTMEGGSVAQEFLVENMADRTQTFGSVFLALTMECCRCHDHKYDPIAMRDYYSLGAFFNSIPERGFYSSGSVQPSPTLLLPNEAQEKTLADAKVAAAAAYAAVEKRIAESDADFDAWLATSPAAPAVDLVSYLTFDGEGPASQLKDDAGAPDANGNGLPRVPGKSGAAVRLDGDTGINLANRLAFERCDPFTVDLVLRDTLANPASSVVLHRSSGTDVGYNGLELRLAGGHLEAMIVRDWPGNAIGVRTIQGIPRDQWARVTWTYDGSSAARGLRLFLDGQPMETEVTADTLMKSTAFDNHGGLPATIGQRFRDRGFNGGEIDELRIWKRQLAPLEVAAVQDPAKWTAALADRATQRAALKEAWTLSTDAPYREALVALRNARVAVMGAENPIFEIPTMRETEVPRPSHILTRGAYDAPRSKENEVGRDTFGQILIPFPKDAPRNRLGLAKWLTDSRHPLTSRVFVNRIWANFFGSGIVETSDNFGLQGSLPSHPELLDWMARDFVSHGWDLKRLCRSIALSATYGQDSRSRPELREKDSANRLLARGPSRRLSSEQVRDLALSSSGLLQQRDGGPPVSPYQPGGDLWKESNAFSPSYHQSSGADLYRRSLYSVWKRTAPLPNMLAFDSPTREVCTIRRPQTNTPLQALVLLNDVQFLEAARALAAKVQSLPAEQRLAAAFEACASRPPTDREAKLLGELHTEQLEQFKASPEEAKKYLAQGSSPVGRDLDPAETAALTVACSAILNLDASVWNR